MNEQETCNDCHGTHFVLDPDGSIVCAGDECAAVFGTWISDDRAALIIQVPTRLHRRAAV